MVLSRRGYLLMLAATASFALMATLVGVVHRLQPELSVAMTSTIRAAFNMAILLLLAWRNPLSLFGDRRPALWARGFFGGLALLGYFAALARIGVGEAAFLNQTSSVWVALLAPVLLRERGSPWIWVAIVGSMAGVFLLTVPRVDLARDVMGRLFGASSGLLAGIAYVLVRRASATNPPEVIVFYFTLISAAISIAFLGLEPLVWPSGLEVWAALFGVGALATSGQLFMTRAYRIGPAASVAAIAYANPLMASILGWWVLSQRPDSAGWVGMGLILACGVALPFFKTIPAKS